MSETIMRASQDRNFFIKALTLAGIDYQTMWLGPKLNATLVLFFDREQLLHVVTFNNDGAHLNDCYVSDEIQNFIRKLPQEDVRTELTQLTDLLTHLGINYSESTKEVVENEDETVVTGIHAVFGSDGTLKRGSIYPESQT